MYDYERSLVKLYGNKKFVLIGVNSDDPSQLSGIIKQNNLTWDSWADGMGGPIARQWKVHSYPTIFIIDSKGIIRAKGHGDDVADMLDQLIKEAGN